MHLPYYDSPMTALSLSSQESHHRFLAGLSRLQLALPAIGASRPTVASRERLHSALQN